MRIIYTWLTKSVFNSHIGLSLLVADIDDFGPINISVSKYTDKIKIPSAQKPGMDFTKGFKTWHNFSTEIRFMLIPIIVLFIAHEFITGKF